MWSIVNKYGRLVLLIIALAPFLSYFSMKVLNMHYYYLLFVLLALSFILIVLTVSITEKKFHISDYTVLFFFFVLYTILSDLLLVQKDLTFKYFYSNELVTSFFALFVIDSIPLDKQFIKKLLAIFILVIVSSFVVIVYQEIVDPTFMTVNTYRLIGVPIYNRRLHSIFSGLGGNISIGLTIVPYLAILVNLYLIKGKRPLSFLLVFLGGMIVLLTKWRWILLNFILVLLVYVRSTAELIKQSVMIIFVTIILSFAGYYLAKSIGLPIDEIVANRIFETQRKDLSKKSAGTRIFAFHVFAKLFPENPWFGKGMKHAFGGRSKDYDLIRALQGRSSQIHVGYLSLLYYYGVFGGLIYFFFLYKMTINIYHNSKRADMMGVFYGILGFLLMNLTEVSFDLLTPGILMLLVFNKYNKQHRINKNNVATYYI